MLNTSSSEEDEYDFNNEPRKLGTQMHSEWKDSGCKSIRTLDLRSKLPAYGSHQLIGDVGLPQYGTLSTGGVPRTTRSPSTGWQPLQTEYYGASKSDPSKTGGRRAPRLGNSSSTSGSIQRYPQVTMAGRDSLANDLAPRSQYSNQFSVSFEGICESGIAGVRLSPVGSSCWSSEQHTSPDLASLISGSTTSVSAGRSLSSVKHHDTQAMGHGQRLQRQPSSGTGYSGGALSIEPSNRMQSTSYSVRSAPLCMGSPVQPKCFRQLTLDMPALIQPQDTPTPPSLIVSDPEEELHKRRLQIYVFASRCIAYPILSPVSQCPTRRYLRVTKDYLLTLKERFQMFIKGKMSINCDEAFRNAISDFYEVVLESDRIASMVKSGSCSMYDIREVFITNIEKRFQDTQLIEGLLKENVISAWKVKFDQICRGGERPCAVAMKLAVPQPEVVTPSKEQLYELLMRTLWVEKYEHQVLYNACQLDNADEQAAQLRRELAEQLQLIDLLTKERRLPKLVHKEMESQYVDEEKLRVKDLMRQVDAIPVMKNYTGSVAPRSRAFYKNPMRNIFPPRTEETPYTVMAERASKSDQELETEATRGWSNSNRRNSKSADRLMVSAGLGHSYGSALAVSSSRTTINGPSYGQPSGISREAVRLTFSLEILVHQLRNVRHLSMQKKVYCTIELDGSADRKRTDNVELSKPVWDTTAEFQTSQPLPLVKIKLYKECSGPLALDDKELGKLILHPNWTNLRTPVWLRLQTNKHCPDSLELQLSVSMSRPDNCKYANYCWIQGRSTFKRWKRRYICLIQVSQYTFVLASYCEGKARPTEFMALDGFTVDYCENRPDLSLNASALGNKPDHHASFTSLTSLSKIRFGRGSHGINRCQRISSTTNVAGVGSDPVASHFFKLVREGDSLTMATSTEPDRQSWVQAIYRATGQTHKPTSNNQQAAASTQWKTPQRDVDSGRSPGIEDLATKPSHTFDHLDLFTELQARSLDFRLQDPFVSLGWLSPGQKILLDEYCLRYGIRECQRYLAFMQILLEKAEHGMRIDPDLIHISYSLCANHVTGKTHHDQAVHTVLSMERQQFQFIKTRLTTLLEKQITEFRYCFPFGRPEGALEKTIGLLERVLTKETGEPASVDIVRNAIRNCLRNAAVLNYERISEYATIESVSSLRFQGMDIKSRRLAETIHLAELCIEVMKQNEEHHAESFSWFSDLFVAHAENFWSLFQMDLFDLLDQLPEYQWEIFDLFQILNDYLLHDSNLSDGNFHQSLANRFAPLVDRYLDLMAESIQQAMVSGFQQERWLPMGAAIANGGPLLNGAAKNIKPAHAPVKGTHSAPFMNSTIVSTDGTGELSISDNQPSSLPPRPVSSRSGIRPSLASECGSRQCIVAGLPFASEPFAYPGDTSRIGTSRACRSVVELIWRLHKIKHFFLDLAWPQPTKAHLMDEQVRVLCAQLLREAVQRTLIELEATVRRCNKATDLLLPIECCTMLNTVTEVRSHLLSLCRATNTMGSNNTQRPQSNATQVANQLHVETEEFFDSIQRSMMVIVIDQFIGVLQIVLNKLTRFDENKLISALLTLTKPNDEEGRAYAAFLHTNLQQLSENLVDEVSFLSLSEAWYTRQMRMIYSWLVHRKSMLLHPYQIKCLSTIVKKIFSHFELQGLPTSVLDTIAYQTVSQRLQVEETTQCVKQESGSNTPVSLGRRKLFDTLGGGLSALSSSTMLHRN